MVIYSSSTEPGAPCVIVHQVARSAEEVVPGETQDSFRFDL
jgi:hypothetical protein